MMIVSYLLLKIINTETNSKLTTNIRQMSKMLKETTEVFSTAQNQFITQVKLDLEGKEELLDKFNNLLDEYNHKTFLLNENQSALVSDMIEKLTEIDKENLHENMSKEIIEETKNKNYLIIDESFTLIENVVNKSHKNNEEFVMNTKNMYEFSPETELKAQCFLDASKNLFKQLLKIKETFKTLAGETIEEISAIKKEKNKKGNRLDSFSTALLIIGCVIGGMLFIGVICIFVHFYKNTQKTEDFL